MSGDTRSSVADFLSKIPHCKEFTPQIMDFIQRCRVLILGAGGLGCELLKNFAMSGFINIDIIDMDVIELSNLNRQFLFTEEDIGKSKAMVAANFISSRIANVKINHHFNKITNFDNKFYSQFHVIASGLDSVSSRLWINHVLCGIGRNQIFVDGGVEGLLGSINVIRYGITPCFNCFSDFYPPSVKYPLCTIASMPRLPEHCIEYVATILWRQNCPFGENVEVDTDMKNHVDWIYKESQSRADEFGINGMTYSLTLGVLKGIIPSFAATNGSVASLAVFEVIKLISGFADSNYNKIFIQQAEGIHLARHNIQKKDDCELCGDC